MIRLARDDLEILSLSQRLNQEETMRLSFSRSTMLTLVAALALSALPNLTADAQTRRTRRVPTTTIVPAGTQLRVRLNDTLSSKEARAGDKFTATVVNPSRYEEAKVTGHIRSIRKSGR